MVISCENCNQLHCRFSYAGTWELVNLFVGTKYFYENMAEKIAKYSRVKGQTDRTEQYASKQECIK